MRERVRETESKGSKESREMEGEGGRARETGREQEIERQTERVREREESVCKRESKRQRERQTERGREGDRHRDRTERQEKGETGRQVFRRERQTERDRGREGETQRERQREERQRERRQTKRGRERRERRGEKHVACQTLDCHRNVSFCSLKTYLCLLLRRVPEIELLPTTLYTQKQRSRAEGGECKGNDKEVPLPAKHISSKTICYPGNKISFCHFARKSRQRDSSVQLGPAKPEYG